jgi:hypothetical protein
MTENNTKAALTALDWLERAAIRDAEANSITARVLRGNVESIRKRSDLLRTALKA